LAERIPARIALDDLRGETSLCQFGNMTVLRHQPAYATRAQARAQAVDQTTKLGRILRADDADLFRRAGLGDNDRQPCHVKAEAGIECIAERGEPLHEQRADVIRIAQRP
jgi:hypothetical protein